jgi:hypothetical protein
MLFATPSKSFDQVQPCVQRKQDLQAEPVKRINFLPSIFMASRGDFSRPFTRKLDSVGSESRRQDSSHHEEMPQDEEVTATTTRQGHHIVKRSYVESDDEEITPIRVKRSYVESDDGGAGITRPRNGRRIVKRSYVESDDSDDEPAKRQFDSASARSHSTTHAEGSSLKERRELPPLNTANLDLGDAARADADSLEPRPEPSLDSRDAPASHTDTEFDDMLDLVAPVPAPPRAQIPNPRKRRRESGNGTDDELASASATNKSVLAFAKQFATHKRLKPVHVSEVEAFAAVRSLSVSRLGSSDRTYIGPRGSTPNQDVYGDAWAGRQTRIDSDSAEVVAYARGIAPLFLILALKLLTEKHSSTCTWCTNVSESNRIQGFSVEETCLGMPGLSKQNCACRLVHLHRNC